MIKNILKYSLLITKKIIKKKYFLYIIFCKLYSYYTWYKYFFYFYIIFIFYKLYRQIKYLIKNDFLIV